MLAFFAAYQTAMGDKTLPGEIIHLGSILLFPAFQESLLLCGELTVDFRDRP